MACSGRELACLTCKADLWRRFVRAADAQRSAFLDATRSILPHMNSEFEWNPVKAASNQKKHSVSFVEAATVFFDPLSITVVDPGHSIDEKRLSLPACRISVVRSLLLHVDRGDRIRIISARRATPTESEKYESGAE
jgi:uncharacterized DUF497 family protein